MRLVTWNCCRGAYLKKAPLLNALAPDIAVIQECARPATATDQCLWFGDNPRQGVAVAANGRYRIRALPAVPGVPRYAIPVEVTGPNHFLLIAVWSKVVKTAPTSRASCGRSSCIASCSLNTVRFWPVISTPTPPGTATIVLA